MNETPNVLPKTSQLALQTMRDEVAEWIVAKGWDDDRTFGDELILIVSELVEALEAFRSNGYVIWNTYQPTVNGIKMPKMVQDQIDALVGALDPETNEIEIGQPRREGVAPEIAGTFVRLLDTCAKHGIDLGGEFRKEMDYNWTRTFRHGGKAL